MARFWNSALFGYPRGDFKANFHLNDDVQRIGKVASAGRGHYLASTSFGLGSTDISGPKEL